MNDLLEIAIKAAQQAGEEIMKVYKTDFNFETKEDKSPLTLADKAAHKKIMSFLSQTSIPVLSEEGKHLPFEERNKWTKFWLVDPLDGTKEFIKRNGEFTVNIALIENGKPILGVIYVPVKDTIYYGLENKAYKIISFSTKPIKKKLPLSTNNDKFVVVGSRSHMSEETEQFFHHMKVKHQEVELMAVGSSLKLCMVAEGKANAYPRFAPTMEWDTGAGHAIVNGAGFKALQYQSDEELIYNKENLLNPWFLVIK